LQPQDGTACRGDLLTGAWLRASGSIIVCRQIANPSAAPGVLMQDGSGSFPERGLPARTGDQITTKTIIHGADSDIALMWAPWLRKSDHSTDKALQMNFSSFRSPVLRLRIFQILTPALVRMQSVHRSTEPLIADCGSGVKNPLLYATILTAGKLLISINAEGCVSG